MKKILLIIHCSLFIGLAGCGSETPVPAAPSKEMVRILSLDYELGGLFANGLMDNRESSKPGAGYLRSYNADFIDADVHIFRAGADGVESNQLKKTLEHINRYIEEYFGGVVQNKRESVVSHRGMLFRRVQFSGHANVVMLVTVYDDAFMQVIFSYPLWHDGEKEIGDFMDALIGNLEGISAREGLTSCAPVL